MSDPTRSLVITCSDRAAQGLRRDESGPAVKRFLEARGFDVAEVLVVADEIDEIARMIEAAIDEDDFRFIVTTGGTGLARRDVTPDATNRIAHKHIPGFGELMRARSLEHTPKAPLSRAQAVTRGSALVINLPGSTAGAVENLEAVIHLVPHALGLLGEEIEHLEHTESER